MRVGRVEWVGHTLLLILTHLCQGIEYLAIVFESTCFLQQHTPRQSHGGHMTLAWWSHNTLYLQELCPHLLSSEAGQSTLHSLHLLLQQRTPVLVQKAGRQAILQPCPLHHPQHGPQTHRQAHRGTQAGAEEVPPELQIQLQTCRLGDPGMKGAKGVAVSLHTWAIVLRCTVAAIFIPGYRSYIPKPNSHLWTLHYTPRSVVRHLLHP